ncbi:MAG TPA: MerR family transcriptional regulator [Polyangiaceae bacterium]|nr:MerR family transcriptional regulator [Polyangiaceae bacterium]
MPHPPGRSDRGAKGAKGGAEAPAPPGGGPFRIRAAAELSGVPAPTLRAWERRYGVPAPGRTASAYRLYTAGDVEQVRRMRLLVEQGVAPAEAARVARATPPLPDDLAPAGGAPGGAVDLARARLLAAAQRFDAPSLDAELARLSMLLDATTLYERVLSPLLVDVGRRWREGGLSVAQEHMLSDRVENALRAALKTLERPEGPLVLVACIDREQHVLGMLGAALKLAASGARVVVLGAMTPPEAVAEAVSAMAPRLVGLSACVVPPSPRALMRAYGRACAGTPWVLGGAAAEPLREAAAEAGGFVALGSSPEWQAQVREWLRGPPPGHEAKAARAGGH